MIDTATNVVVATVTVGTSGSDSGSDPAGIAVSPTGSHVYVTILREDKVKVIDTTNYTVVATVQLPLNSKPYGVGTARPADQAGTLIRDREITRDG